MKRATIRDIAEAVGIHHSTVSRALKNEPRISLAMRERVSAAASQLGYQPDPMLSSLMVYRNDNRIKKRRATIAWVTNYTTRDGWHAYERNGYFRGATARAKELGYVIDEFWLKEPDMTPRRATQILFNRSILGLLYIPRPRSRAHLSLDWSRFSTVSFGRTLASPRLHNVDNDHYSSIAILMRQLKKRGYRRIGMALWPRDHEAGDRRCAAACWAFQAIPSHEQIPVFMKPLPWDKRDFQAWMKKYRPDAVISLQGSVSEWIVEMGLKIPDEVGFASMAKHPEHHPHLSGIDENNELVGRTAVDVLVRMIQNGETGIPPIPISTLVEGSWMNGESTRHVNLQLHSSLVH